jgi:hypothetical protein
VAEVDVDDRYVIADLERQHVRMIVDMAAR